MKSVFLSVLVFAGISSAGEIQPLMVEASKIVYQSDFSEPEDLKKAGWKLRQGTRWDIKDGILRGQPSSPEFQAKKAHHKGLEPRISASMTPAEFVASFSVRFLDGEQTAIVPFVEFGHHIVRLRFSESEGLALLADYESLKLAEAPGFRFEPERWYHVLVELKGDEFVAQFKDGPTLYAKHDCFSEPAPSGGTGLGVAGPRGGLAELDNVILWDVKPKVLSSWESTKKEFPQFQPVKVREKPVK